MWTERRTTMVTLLIAVVVLFVAIIATVIGSGLRAATMPVVPSAPADWAVDLLTARPWAFVEVTGFDAGTCTSQWVYSPEGWYNVCARMSSRITEEGVEILSPLSWRIEMAIYDGDRFYAVCNDPVALCNGLEVIRLKAEALEAELDRSFGVTFNVAVWMVLSYGRGELGNRHLPRLCTLRGETVIKGVPVSKWGYIMSLAFRRGVIITPAVKAAKAATLASSSRGDSRKSNRGGEERAEALRNSRAFVRSQKEVELY